MTALSLTMMMVLPPLGSLVPLTVPTQAPSPIWWASAQPRTRGTAPLCAAGLSRACTATARAIRRMRRACSPLCSSPRQPLRLPMLHLRLYVLMPLLFTTAMSVAVSLGIRYVLRREGVFLLVRLTRTCLRLTTTLHARRAPAPLSLTAVTVRVTMAAVAVSLWMTRLRSMPALSSPGS